MLTERFEAALFCCASPKEPESMASMLSKALVVAIILLTFSIVVVLIRKYFNTRDSGFLWLGAAIVLWPLVEQMLNRSSPFIDHVFHGYSRGSALMLMTMSLKLIALILQLVAIVCLCRNKNNPPSIVGNH